MKINYTRFGHLLIGEKFKLPGSDVLMSKEPSSQEPGLGRVNAIYDITGQERRCYVHDDTQVVRRRSNENAELR